MTRYEIDILKKALMKVELNELERFKRLPEQEYEYTEEFKNNIRALAKKRKTFLWQATKTVPRRVAFALAAVLVTFCLMMSISAIRIPVVNFFVNAYEDFIEIFIEENKEIEIPDSIEEVYKPTYIPTGYTELSYSNTGMLSERMWSDENYDLIIFTQDVLDSGTQNYMDNEGVEFKNIKISDLDIYYCSKHGSYLFVWTNGYYYFQLVCSEELGLNEAERIIESLTVTEIE